jgi:adenylate cyclase
LHTGTLAARTASGGVGRDANPQTGRCTIELPFPSLSVPFARSALRWINDRRSLQQTLSGLRHALPGDSRFGDSLSTAGKRPLDLIASRAYSLQQGRFSALGEAGLLALQLAEWAAEERRADPQSEVAIVFMDLAGFSTWALEAGDERSIELLRRVDTVVSSAVAEHAGTLVKRLGDGWMATFPTPLAATLAADQAVSAVSRVRFSGYSAAMRASVRWGSPQAIGGDYVGVDVNIAARMCDAARPGEVLVCEEIRARLDDRWRTTATRTASFRGAPEGLRIHGVRASSLAEVYDAPERAGHAEASSARRRSSRRRSASSSLSSRARA